MNWLGRILHYVISPLIFIFATKPRVRVILHDGEGRVLLIKGWLSRQQWSIPGGGIMMGESVEAAAIREIQEETGLVIDPKQLKFIGNVKARYPMRCTLHVYSAKTSSVIMPKLSTYRKIEIIDRAWVSIDNLPSNIHPLTGLLLKEQKHNL